MNLSQKSFVGRGGGGAHWSVLKKNRAKSLFLPNFSLNWLRVCLKNAPKTPIFDHKSGVNLRSRKFPQKMTTVDVPVHPKLSPIVRKQ